MQGLFSHVLNFSASGLQQLHALLADSLLTLKLLLQR
jgi:hypothetical protein